MPASVHAQPRTALPGVTVPEAHVRPAMALLGATTGTSPVKAPSVHATALDASPGATTTGTHAGTPTALLGHVVTRAPSVHANGLAGLPAPVTSEAHVRPPTGLLGATTGLPTGTHAGTEPATRTHASAPAHASTHAPAHTLAPASAPARTHAEARMKVTQPQPTSAQKFAQARRMIPALATLRMKARDEFVGMIDQGDKIVCVIITHRVRELARETRITHKGTRTLVCMNGEIVSDTCLMYELPEPIIESHFAVKMTPAYVAEQTKRYQECYRPGSGGRFGQRDSYSRACQGYTS